MSAERAVKAERIAAWEERAAIIEDSGVNRTDAEERATRELGYRPKWSGSILNVIEAGEVK